MIIDASIDRQAKPDQHAPCMIDTDRLAIEARSACNNAWSAPIDWQAKLDQHAACMIDIDR
jgi:hypothetical protein